MKENYELKYLKGRKLKIFLSVSDILLPDTGDSFSCSRLSSVAIVDRCLSRLPDNLRKKLLFFLMVIEFMGLFFGGHLFSKNNEKAKIRQLEWLEKSPLRLFRLGFFGIKNYVSMGFYTKESVWQDINYPGPHFPDRPFEDEILRSLCQEKLEVIL